MPPAFDYISKLLAERNMPHVIHTHAVARTVAEAEALGLFPVEHFLKTVVFRVKSGGWVLAAMRAHASADYKKLAAVLGVKRDELVRPTPEEMEAALGFEAGAVGPIPTTPETQVVFDAHAVLTLETVYCGCGRADRTLAIHIQTLLMLTGGRVVSVVKEL